MSRGLHMLSSSGSSAQQRVAASHSFRKNYEAIFEEYYHAVNGVDLPEKHPKHWKTRLLMVGEGLLRLLKGDATRKFAELPDTPSTMVIKGHSWPDDMQEEKSFLPSTKDVVFVGRMKENDVVVGTCKDMQGCEMFERSVSRLHALVFPARELGRVFVVDVGSFNGIRVSYRQYPEALTSEGVYPGKQYSVEGDRRVLEFVWGEEVALLIGNRYVTLNPRPIEVGCRTPSPTTKQPLVCPGAPLRRSKRNVASSAPVASARRLDFGEKEEEGGL